MTDFENEIKKVKFLSKNIEEIPKKETKKNYLSISKTDFSEKCKSFTKSDICYDDSKMILKNSKFDENSIFEFHFGKTVVEDKSKNENIFFGNFNNFFGSMKNNNLSSFLFKEDSYSFIELKKKFEIQNFSLLLNFMIIKNTDKKEKIIFLSENPFFLQISINEKKKLKIKYILEDEETELISFAKIKKKIWKNILIEKNEKALSLFINGIKDNLIILKKTQKIIIDQNSIINLIPEKTNSNFIIAFQKIKFQKNFLSNFEKQKLFIYNIIEYGFIKFGCFECNYEKALKSCLDDFKICSSLELYSGILKIIQNIGWENLNYYLFTSDTDVNNSSVLGMAICCRNH